MEKVKYVKCPRCDVNYMKSTAELCDVCIAELARKLSAEDDDEERILCPICNKNYIELDEEMCASCLAERDEEAIPDSVERDEDWRSYLDDDKDIPIDKEEIEISLSELESEESEDETVEDELDVDLVDVFDSLNS